MKAGVKYIGVFSLFLSAAFLVLPARAQKNRDVAEECNCNGRQFQDRYAAKYNEETFLTDFLIDYKVDSGEDNLEYVYTQMKQKLALSLAKKIRSKVSSTETMNVSSAQEGNGEEKVKQEYVSTAKAESDVVLSGTDYHFCPDKKHHDLFHGMIFINRAQFLSSQLALLKMTVKDLELVVNNLSKNSMDYSTRQLAIEIRNCIKKKNKMDDLIGIYTTLSLKNEILEDPAIQKSKDNINSKLLTLKKKLGKDAD